MNRLSDRKEFLIDKMLCLAYSVRTIAEVVQVSRKTVQDRRAPLVWGGAFGLIDCPCGKTVQDWDSGAWHDQEPCARRARRNRLLLRIVRNQRKPKEKPRLSMSTPSLYELKQREPH